jgi:hypothetical protein
VQSTAAHLAIPNTTVKFTSLFLRCSFNSFLKVEKALTIKSLNTSTTYWKWRRELTQHIRFFHGQLGTVVNNNKGAKINSMLTACSLDEMIEV